MLAKIKKIRIWGDTIIYNVIQEFKDGSIAIKDSKGEIKVLTANEYTIINISYEK